MNDLPVVGDLADRALWRITTFTSRLGERRRLGWLTYNPLQLLAYHRYAAHDASAVMSAFARVFPGATAYVDVGAGSGAYAAEAGRRGIAVAACEYSWSGRYLARRQGIKSRPLDLARTPPTSVEGRFDLAYSFEVAEHVPDELGLRLVSLLLELSDTVIFSAAHPGQGGLGHINERPREDWIARFGRAGARYDGDATAALAAAFLSEGVQAAWLADNAMVFTRA